MGDDIEKKKIEQFWNQEIEVIDSEDSRSEIVSCIEDMAQFWQHEASRSEIVACAKNMAQFWQQEASRSEIVIFVTELVNQNKRLIDRVRQLSFTYDRLCSSLENLTAETKGVREDVVQTMTQAIEEGRSDKLVKETFDSVEELPSPSPQLDVSPLFHGEIEIAVAPPVHIAQLVRFHRDLHSVLQLNISRTSGSQNGCPVITVLIAEPLPLISLLKRMPEVEKVELLAGKEVGDNGIPLKSVLDSEPERSQESIVVTLNDLQGVR